ncbi:conserved hypothetical protein [Xenorhabdus szentirmaii DSM 16338]|uniref:Uncharacterized protein n=1 Tax=Xenorhabdus szentirmaii DSM 16338 TaxID=1427518 RepID=W1ITQ3_9GAMM|nr:hypothetical protein [Xenorhabdus szentirmaii]PHM30519.1 hypothetical protein Xsze_04109 [Xenorhabdus szentirmaii DSM 16338]CDL80976.1 conserved hypothetical protein [Xenorhabdus szentirmaii DSM 16338]
MAGNKVENIKLGACNVSFNGIDLGYTKGGVEVEVTTDTLKVTVDQFGETTVSELIQGRNIKVTVPLAETVLERLATVMPGSEVGGSGDEITIKTGIGINLVEVAQSLVLTPLNKDDYVLTLPRTATAGSFNMAYKHDDVRVFNIEFNAYPDDSGVLGKMAKKK